MGPPVPILPEAKKLAKNRLIHVFGSAGKRDTYKRPEMGSLSAKYADIIILTSEDPRTEPIEKINKDILGGVKDNRFLIVDGTEIKTDTQNVKHAKYIYVIPDRKKAVTFAIDLAQKGDVVLMTGKGHEKSMNYGKGEEAWDENETAVAALQNRKLL